MHEPVSIPAISSRRLVGLLLVLAACLCAASLSAQFIIHILERDDLEPWLIKFDVDAEANLPTWFSSALLLAAAGGFVALTARARRQSGPAERRAWIILAAGFLAMSIDETAQLHEEFGVLQSLLHTHGLLYFAWLIPAIGVVITAGIVLLPALARMPIRLRNGMLLAGGIYLTGALGVEALGGWHAETAGFNNFTHSLIATLEEALEMTGVILLLGVQTRALSIHVNPVSTTPSASR